MIFVILGLLILFVSFVVALISLLREQRESAERGLPEADRSREMAAEEESRPAGKVDQPGGEPQTYHPKQQEEDLIPEAQIEEAFPWEKDKPESVEENLSKDQEHSQKSHLEGVIVIPRKSG